MHTWKINIFLSVIIISYQPDGLQWTSLAFIQEDTGAIIFHFYFVCFCFWFSTKRISLPFRLFHWLLRYVMLLSNALTNTVGPVRGKFLSTWLSRPVLISCARYMTRHCSRVQLSSTIYKMKFKDLIARFTAYFFYLGCSDLLCPLQR